MSISNFRHHFSLTSIEMNRNKLIEWLKTKVNDTGIIGEALIIIQFLGNGARNDKNRLCDRDMADHMHILFINNHFSLFIKRH